MRKLFTLVAFALIFFASATFCTAQSDVPPPSDMQINAAADRFHEYDYGYSIDDMIAALRPGSSNNSIVISKTYKSHSEGDVYRPDKPARGLFSYLAEGSDDVVIGTPIKRWSYLTVGKKFVFSIYAVKLSRVLGATPRPMLAGDIIYIARAGGILEQDGRNIRGTDPDFHLLHLNEPYVFFGTMLYPDTYKIDSQHVFLLSGEQVLESSTKSYDSYKLRGKDRAALLAEIEEGLSKRDKVNQKTGSVR